MPKLKKGNTSQKPPMTDQDSASPETINSDDEQTLKEVLQSKISPDTDDSNQIQEEYSTQQDLSFHQSFTSMTMYCKDLSPKLLYEDQTSFKEDCEVLSHDDGSMRWRKAKSVARQGLDIKIVMTPQFSKRFRTEKMEKMEQNPFFRDQGMVIISKTGTPWFGYIENIYSTKEKSSDEYNSQEKTLRMLVKLYYWNQNEPPSAKAFESMHILPLSVGISRAFTAMASISIPIIKEMILGNVSVTEIKEDPKLDLSDMTLNSSQKEAITTVMSNSVTILQGPPGTGKTTTIAAIVSQCLKQDIYPILVLAASNTAVDNIAVKLLKHDDNILRVVAGVREHEYGEKHRLARVCLHRKVYELVPPEIQKIMKNYSDPLKFITGKEREKMNEARIRISDGIVTKSKVILATTVVSGGPQFKKVTKVPMVVIDEATQSPEYSTLIPLAFPGIEKVVLVGDRKQLSGYAETPALSMSLFERLLINETYKPERMLDTQYRMHPEISEFPRHRFYNGFLFDGIGASDRHISGFNGNRVVFWDNMEGSPESSGMEMSGEIEKWSFCNMGEVKKIEEVLYHLIHQKNIARNRIGIIAPYAGQRNLLSSLIAKNTKLATKKKASVVEGNDVDALKQTRQTSIQVIYGITISSIDAFQGHEKDFIILSCVRSNDKGSVGFLNDKRRLNVALTRAKHGLVIVGDAKCLSKKDELWKGFIGFLEQKGWLSQAAEFSFG